MAYGSPHPTASEAATSEVTSEAPSDRAFQIAAKLSGLHFGSGRLAQPELELAATTIAASPELYEDLVVDSTLTRWWIILHRTPGYEVRLLSWEYDQSSGWHDHGGSSGGFAVTSGVLLERCRSDDGVSIDSHRFERGAHGHFGPAHVHDVLHAEGQPAVSIHAYSPPLTVLTRYEVTRFGFVAVEITPDDQRDLDAVAQRR
ncbi:MAG: cysteine dioxygenase [Acidimicrobiales bacterium]